MEILKIIYAAALGQGLLIIILLLLVIKKNNIKSNLFLLGVILMMLKSIYQGYASLQGWDILKISQLSVYPMFLHAPFIYCYCALMTKKNLSNRMLVAQFGWLLLPFIWIQLQMYQQQLGLKILYFCAFLQIVIYYALSVCLLRDYSATIKINFSNIDNYTLQWLYILVTSLGVLMVIDLGSAMLTAVFELPEKTLLIPHLLVLECAYVFAIGIFAAKQPRIIFAKPLVDATQKYARSSLNHAKAETLVTEIKQLMQQDELYLDNELSLSDLALKLKVPSVHLSQALNENLGCNFYDYINQLRIDKSKQLLISATHLDKPILDIAFEVGFNNKTSFNNAFKKYTHLTPSQYRQQNRSTTN